MPRKREGESATAAIAARTAATGSRVVVSDIAPMGLLVAEFLQPVFGAAQKDISAVQLQIGIIGDIPLAGQNRQHPADTAFLQVRHHPAADELEGLPDELDLTDTTATELDVVLDAFAFDLTPLVADLRAREGDEQEREDHKRIDEALKKTFRPEFINRIDEIVTFHPLDKEHLRQIVEIQLGRVASLLFERGFDLDVTPDAVPDPAGSGATIPEMHGEIRTRLRPRYDSLGAFVRSGHRSSWTQAASFCQ